MIIIKDEKKKATVNRIINILADEQYTVDEARKLLDIANDNIMYMSTAQTVQHISSEDD